MPTEIDKILETFPHKTINVIEGTPTFSALQEIQIQLNANAASVQSDLGDGLLGLLYLTVTPATYNTLSAIPFIPPVNPGALPQFNVRATSREVAAARAEHEHNLRIFREFHNTDKALKSLLIGAVDDMYIKALRHRITGYAQVSTRQILDHLYLHYGKLTPQDLQINDSRMKTPYNPHEPIENLYEQIEKAVEVASAALAPYDPTQVVNTAYTLVFNAGVFQDSCREWRKFPQVQKTWPNFKIHFSEAHRDYVQLQNQAGGGQNPFHYNTANSVELMAATEEHNPEPIFSHETAEALANLASATASDRATVASLTTTNEKLTAQLGQLTNQLSLAMTKIAEMEKLLAAKPVNLSTRSYCWTHGFRVSKNHNSESCKNPAPGHKKEATATNRKGGSTNGMPQHYTE